MKKYCAEKIKKYVVEPKTGGFSDEWESFHATNPSSMRLDGLDCVLLAYRAGGTADKYHIPDIDIWGSSMGLCLLDKYGEEVLYRFPLPVFWFDRKGLKLPQNNAEHAAFIKEYSKQTIVYHDFRFVADGDTVYILTHNGAIDGCYDAIYKTGRAGFIRKITESVKLVDAGNVTKEKWRGIWADTFSPCGTDSSGRFFGSDVNKTDIVILRTGDKVQISHRPVPDLAVEYTGGEFYLKAEADGITKYGVLETCTRPGYIDNSHVGNNGNPIKARLYGQDVYIDVPHGVNNRSLSLKNPKKNWDLTYFCYFRVRAADGRLLYYSQKPILYFDEIWKEYAEDGAWISRLDHLRGVMFAGGQVARDKDKITENDEFIMYTGIGDTAVARAVFTPARLLPKAAAADIKSYTAAKSAAQKLGADRNEFKLPVKFKGREYSFINGAGGLNICRRLNCADGRAEYAERPVTGNAGFFDSAAVLFGGGNCYMTEYGITAAYKGLRYHHGKLYSGYGVIILHNDNPEKILYKSEKPLGKQEECTAANVNTYESFDREYLLSKVSKKVLFEIKQTYQFEKDGRGFNSDHTKWLKIKCGD